MSNLSAKNFFEKFIGETTYNFKILPQSGSRRVNFVGTAQNHHFIITQNENIRENEAFFYFSNEFAKLNLNTPKIFIFKSFWARIPYQKLSLAKDTQSM